MFDLIVLIIFVIVSIRIARIAMSESAIFEEFNQSKSLSVVVLLFPLGPVALLTLPFLLGWLPAVVAATLCYIPAFIISRKVHSGLEHSGTDRTDKAQKVAHQAFLASIGGLFYVLILTLIIIGVGSINVAGT